MYLDEEKDLRINQLRLILFVMVAVFIVMLIYTISWVVDYNNKIESLVKTDAEVVEHKVVSGQTRDVVLYYVNGVDYMVTADIESRYDVGEEITIYYDNDNPMSYMFDDNRKVVLPIICGCFLAICIALAITYIIIYISRKKEVLLQKKLIEEQQKAAASEAKSTKKSTTADNAKTTKNTKKKSI